MLEDKLLIWKFNLGSRDALGRIYEKYKNDLFALAIALSNDNTDAEDIVHDVFVSFAQSVVKLQLRRSLKSYLLTSVANRVRSSKRVKPRQAVRLDEAEIAGTDSNHPDQAAISKEQSQQIGSALAELPYQQRVVITLHLYSNLRIKEIAKSKGVSINTIQSRYRYGLNKLQSILNGEVEK
ncbi:RNA polymerase sigma factor [Planctomycetota bacterium]